MGRGAQGGRENDAAQPINSMKPMPHDDTCTKAELIRSSYFFICDGELGGESL